MSAGKEERVREDERRRMVKGLQLSRVHYPGEDVSEAMMRVKRHLFVPPSVMEQAYSDYPLPIGEGQTISAPHMVAMMCGYLELKKGEKVLEIGAGSGYHAAVIAELIGETGRVYSVERVQWLVDFSKENLKRAGYKHVTVMQGDGTLGLPEHAPYDKISVTCAAPAVPPPLLEQLKVGGKMVIPIGKYLQELYLVKKKEKGIVEQEKKCDVAFVPLVGQYGFR